MTSQRLGIEVLTSEGSITKLVAPPHITSRAVAIGSQAELLVEGEGVAPEHLFAIVRDGRLLVASATTAIPVMMVDRRIAKRPSSPSSSDTHKDDLSPPPPPPRREPRDSSSTEAGAAGGVVESALPPARWVAIDLPCRVRLGATVVRLVWLASSSKSENRRVVQPPPSLMMLATPPPDSERTTQRRPRPTPPPALDASTTAAAGGLRRTLPPTAPPPRRLETWTRVAEGDATGSLGQSPKSARALVAPAIAGSAGAGSRRDSAARRASDPTLDAYDPAVTLRTPLPAPAPLRTPLPAPSPPPARATRESSNAPSRPSSSTSRSSAPPPSHATKVHAIAPNAASSGGIPRMIVPTPARGSLATMLPPQQPHASSGEAFLFQMASRAVDAWNKFVDDMDSRKSGPALGHRERERTD